jgi:UDP:flavonoid glycosyltransferase YjiC (YdhE family)
VSERILFLVNGLGLGNSTRCHAIIQRLHEQGVRIEVVTSGNGLWYFADRPEVAALHEIESLYYGKKEGRLSVLRTVFAIGDFVRIMRNNTRRIAQILDEFEPDTVVTDSVYTLGPMRRRRILVAALNNADVIHHAYRLFADRPSSIKAQFYAVEEADFLFHRFGPDLVLSPTLDPSVPQSSGPYRRIGPIVRRGYAASPVGQTPEKVVIMLSGSVFGTPVTLTRADHPVRIDIVGRPAPEGWREDPRVRYHGRIRETGRVLSDADLVIVNGGFSAVSELFCMGKPMLVVPVPNHAEQWINARTVKHLAVGDIIDEDSIETAIGPALERIGDFRAAYGRLPPPPDGAAQAAQAILELARDGRP